MTNPAAAVLPRETGKGDPTTTAIVRVGFRVDAHATATALPSGTTSARATGTGTIDTCFPGTAGMPALPTVAGIGLGIGAGSTTAIGSVTWATGIAADVCRCAAGLIVDARLAHCAANAVATHTGATGVCGAALPCGNTGCDAVAVSADFARATLAMRAAIGGAIVTAVSHTADLRRRGSFTGVAKPRVMGRIARALVCRGRVGTEHVRAPVRTIPVRAEDAAKTAQTEKAAD